MCLEYHSFIELCYRLILQTADMIFAAISVTPQREQVMDFVEIPFFHDSVTFAYRLPDASKDKWKIILLPFTSTVWLCLGLALVVTALAAVGVTKGCQAIRTSSTTLGWGDIMWFCFGTAFNQGNLIC